MTVALVKLVGAVTRHTQLVGQVTVLVAAVNRSIVYSSGVGVHPFHVSAMSFVTAMYCHLVVVSATVADDVTAVLVGFAPA